MRNFQGSIVAIITPFLENGLIDYDAYQGLLDFHLQNGTNGIVVCGTTGETPTLTEVEYRNIIQFTVKYINGRLPVIAGSGSNSTHKAIHYSQMAVEAGVDGLLVVSPYYNKPSATGMYEHFEQVANSVDVPIILYNVPGRTGKNMPVEVTLRLARDFENIVAIKEAAGSIEQVMEIINNAPSDFHVLSGDDALALPMIAMGAKGCVSVVANQIPKAFSQMIDLALNGNWERARRLHYQYLDLMNLNFIDSNPVPVKKVLAMMGMIQETYRNPLTPMNNPQHIDQLAKEVQYLGLIESVVAWAPLVI